MAIADQIKGVLPAVNVGTIWAFLFYLTLFVLFMLIIGCAFGLWLWWYLGKKKFNLTIQKFEKIDGIFKPTGKEKAMERRIGKSGDTVFYWKQSKRVVPRGTIQTGDRTYWYAKREDGEWENIGLEDIDLVLKQAQVRYTPVELRYAKESLREMIKEVYSPANWWQKWQGVLISIVFIVLVSCLLLLIATKLGAIVSSVDAVLKSVPPILERLDTMLGAMDNLCSNSGIVR